MKKILVFMFMLVSIFGHSQDVDSLILASTKTPVDTINLEALLSLCKYYVYSDKAKVNKYTKRGLHLADSLDNEDYKVEFLFKMASNQEHSDSVSFYLSKAKELAAYHHMDVKLMRIDYKWASYYLSKGNKEKALEIYHGILDNKTLRKPENARGISSVYYQIGNIKKENGAYDTAMDMYLNGLEVIEQDTTNNPNNKNVKLAILTSLGSLMSKIKDYPTSLKYFRQALNLLDIDTDRRAPVIFNNMGNVYSNNENVMNLDSARAYYHKALNGNISEKTKAYSYQGLGIIATKEEKFEEALIHYNNAAAIMESLGNNEKKGLFISLIGQTYYKMGDYRQALSFLEKAKRQTSEVGNVEQHHESDKFIISSRLKLGLPVSFEDFDAFVIEGDSIYSADLSKNIKLAITKFETEKKEAENELLKKEKQLQAQTISNQKYVMMGTIGGLGLLGFISYLLYRQSSERKKKNTILARQRDQIDALHKDLAHRVKNNLFFVSTLMKMQANKMEDSQAKQAIMEGEARIEAMSLLHRKLNLNTENELIDMKDYIGEICDNLKYSFPYEGARPVINFSSDELHIDGERAMRIGLIINELVTNAFKHAFTGVSSPTIDIHISAQSPEGYSVSYADNGIGMDTTIDIHKSESMGLKLIHTLTRQLNGSLNMKKQDIGTAFEFEFKNNKKAA